MKILKLKVLDRLMLQMLLNGDGKGNHSLSELNQLFKILDKVYFSDEENKELEIKNENGMIKWNAIKDEGKDFEISDEQNKILVDAMVAKDKKKEFDLSNLKTWTYLAEQIGFKFE